MQIAGLYSFAGGKDVVERLFSKELSEVKQAILSVDANKCKTKKSREKTMRGRMLFSPIKLNREFVIRFKRSKWTHGVREYCEYPRQFYVDGYAIPKETQKPFRDMDFVKNKLGCEVQFGKYSFMVYNVCAKNDHLQEFRPHQSRDRNSPRQTIGRTHVIGCVLF